MSRARAAVAVTALALGVPEVAAAVPPGGAADAPGTPPATVAVTTSTVPVGGHVAFRGTGFLTASGAPQLVYLKVDDAGDAGIGPYRAAADGTVRGTLWLGAPGLPAAVGRPGTHWLRFLAGPSGAHPENGPPRSLTATFRLAEASVRPAASTLTTDGVAATLRLRATRRATGTVRLRRTNGAATLARASFSLSGRGTVALRVPLTAAGRRAVESDARLAVRLRITPTGGASTLHSASLRTR